MSADAVRAIVDANRYLTLATADASGRPWASPVWFATADYREFFWVSKPQARHSRDVAVRPQVANRATAHEHFVLDARDERVPVDLSAGT